jgi:hypothetical protein
MLVAAVTHVSLVSCALFTMLPTTPYNGNGLRLLRLRSRSPHGGPFANFADANKIITHGPKVNDPPPLDPTPGTDGPSPSRTAQRR